MEINKTYLRKNKKKKKGKKTVIMLQNSYNSFSNYLNFLNSYIGGNHNEYPHFIVTKTGEIFQFLEETHISHVSEIETFYKMSINIVLENTGYFTKIYEGDKEHFIDWIGNKTEKSDLIYKNYKTYNYWDSYTDIQLKSLSNLCTYLCDKYGIEKDIYSHNYTITELPDVRNFRGVLSRSNVHLKFLDLHDGFDHKMFRKYFLNDK